MQLSKIETQVHPAAIVLGGIALSFLSALAPTDAHAIQLLPLQVTAGLLPYAVFGMIAAMLHTPGVTRIGLVVLAAHAATAVLQRGLSPDHGGGPVLVVVPLLAAIALLALWPRAVRASAIPSGEPASIPEKSG